MPKTLLKLDMLRAVRTNATKLILLFVSVILGTLIVVGQQGEPMTKKQIPVSDRIENAIKAKEPKFKLAGKLLRNNEKEKYALLGWQSPPLLLHGIPSSIDERLRPNHREASRSRPGLQTQIRPAEHPRGRDHH